MTHLITHIHRLKSQILLFMICWGLLTLYYPTDGAEVSKWWTAVYAIAKFSLAVIVAHISIHELFPYMRLSDQIHKYFNTRYRHGYEVADALVIGSMLIFRAIMYGVAIYVLCIW